MNYQHEPDAHLVAKKRQYIKKKKQMKTLIIASLCVIIVAVWILIGFTIHKLYKTYVPEETTAQTESENVQKPAETDKTQVAVPGSFYESVSGRTTLEITKEQIYEGSLIIVTEHEDRGYRATDANIVAMNYSGKPYKLPDGSIKCEAAAFDAAKDMFGAFYNEKHNGNYHIRMAYFEAADSRCTAEHLTGYAFDINIFDGTPTALADAGEPYNWIYDNAAKYGFVLRYPESDPDHFRYVGRGHSSFMSENALTLEQYVGELQRYMYGKEHLIFSYDGVDYESFYVNFEGETENVTIELPEGVAYTLSGDNVSGVIVTLYK